MDKEFTWIGGSKVSTSLLYLLWFEGGERSPCRKKVTLTGNFDNWSKSLELTKVLLYFHGKLSIF
jgi:hypothetical protein